MTPEPLSEVLRRAPLASDEALALALAIAAALDARRRRSAHVGLDLDDVTVERDGVHLRVSLHPPTRIDPPPAGLALAARVSLAPEAIAGADADDRADVYALGVILYIALTGRSPFEATSPVESLTIKLCGATPGPAEVAPPGAIAAEVDRLVRNLIAADDAHRPRLDEARARLAALAPVPAPAVEPATAPPEATSDPDESRFFADGDELQSYEDEPAPPRRAAGRRIAAAILLAAALIVIAIVVASRDVRPRDPAASTVARPTAAGPPQPDAAATPVEPEPETPTPAAPVTAPPRSSRRMPPAEGPPRAVTPRRTPASPVPEPVPTTAPAAAGDADWLAAADDARRAGQSGDAYRAYFRASKSADRAIAATGHLGMAEIGLAQRRYTEALRNAHRALDLGADARPSWRVIADAACALGDAEQAEVAHSRLGGGSCP